MYCEKCGKQNDDGAIFCSNCSSVLRSRRQSSQPADGETKRFKVPEEAAETVRESVKPVVNDMPSAPVAVREKAVKTGIGVDYEEEPPKRVSRRRPEPRKTFDEYEEYDEKPAKTGSTWFGILAVVSWLSFIAFAAVGIVGGGFLVMMGLGDSNNQLFMYLGIAAAIVFVVIGLTILSKNMVKIKIAKTLNELKLKK